MTGYNTNGQQANMRLSAFINKYYDGVVTAFARDNGIARQQVDKALATRRYYVISTGKKLILVNGSRELINPTKGE